jgi:hypothetical protein
LSACRARLLNTVVSSVSGLFNIYSISLFTSTYQWPCFLPRFPASSSSSSLLSSSGKTFPSLQPGGLSAFKPLLFTASDAHYSASRKTILPSRAIIVYRSPKQPLISSPLSLILPRESSKARLDSCLESQPSLTYLALGLGFWQSGNIWSATALKDLIAGTSVNQGSVTNNLVLVANLHPSFYETESITIIFLSA